MVRDRIEEGGALERRQWTVVELLDANGVAQFSQLGIPFFESNQKADVGVLRVRKPDGSETDLLAEAPRNVAPLLPPALPVYSDLQLLRVAVPSLAVGDRLTFETVQRTEPLAPGMVWSEFQFSRPAKPEVNAYELDLPEGSALGVHLDPGLDLELEEERRDGRWVRRWRLREADDADEVGGEPADEEATAEGEPPSAEKGFRADIEVTSFASWEAFARWWMALAPPEPDRAVGAKAKELTAGLESSEAKLRALHRYVAQEIRYLALPLGLARFRAREPGDVMRTGFGDCKDKHRLLASLAAAAGLEVDAVLIHANGRRLVEESPGPHQFDHVVSRARLDGGRTLWMDATSEMTPAGGLLANLRGVRALALGGGAEQPRVEIVETPAELPFETSTQSETVGELDVGGAFHGSVRWTLRGDDERVRLVFKYGDATVRRALVEQYRGEWRSKAKIGEVRHGDPADLDTPFWFEYDVDYQRSDVSWREGWDLWIQVPVIWIEGPPDEGERPDEIELDQPVRIVRTARIELPEGAQATPPVPIQLERAFASYRSDYHVEGRTLILERELVRKVDRVPRAQFADLEAFREVVDDDRDQEFDLAPAPLLAPVTAETADELEERGWEAQRAKRYAEAEALFRRATELDPEHGSAWASLGQSLIALDRLDEAESALDRQIEIDPHHKKAYGQLARVFWHRGDLESAERLFRREIDVAPLEAYAYGSLGRLLLHRNAFDEAETMLSRARKLDPESETTVPDLIRLYTETGRATLAMELLAEHPDPSLEADVEAWLVGKLLYEGASEAPWRPVRAWLERVEANTAETLKGIDPAAQSVELAGAATAIGPIWEAKAQIAIESGRFAEASGLLRAALPLTQSPLTAGRLGAALRGAGDDTSANLHLALAITLHPQTAKRYEALLAAAVPSLDERRALGRKAAEESLRLKTIVRRVPAAPQGEARLLLAFDVEGRLRRATPLGGGSAKALAANLEVEPPTIAVPRDNLLAPVVWADAFCKQGGECTLLLEAPLASWAQLRK